MDVINAPLFVDNNTGLKDARGKEIYIGSVVGWAVHGGSSMWVNWGKVIAVSQRKNMWSGKKTGVTVLEVKKQSKDSYVDKPKEIVKIERIDRVFVLPE